MPQTNPFGSGTTPQTSDTKRTLWAKQLLVLQAGGGSNTANNLNPNDTIYRIKRKLLRAKQGI